MSGTTPDLPTSEEVADGAPTLDPEHEALAPDAAVADLVASVGDGAAPPAEDLGLFAPTWYVLLCAVPFALAFLVPMLVIYQGQGSVPPITAAAASWHGVLTGWGLWAIGLVFWLLGKVVLSTPRARAPHAWAWWDRMTRAWVLVVLVWGLVASAAVLVVGVLVDRLAA